MVNQSDEGSDGNEVGFAVSWLPALCSTAETSITLINEMLELINGFDSELPLSTINQANQRTMHRKRREQVFGEQFDEHHPNYQFTLVPKSEDTKYFLARALKGHYLFSTLHDTEMGDMVDAMDEAVFSAGDMIIKQGEQGDLFYVLEQGSVAIEVQGTRVGSLKAGDAFGELALLYNSPRAASIIAESHCVTWILDRKLFRQFLMSSSTNQTYKLSQFLARIPFLEPLRQDAITRLARSLQPATFTDGQYIVRQGDPGDAFFILYAGMVKVTQNNDDGVEKYLITLHEGDFFGERALIRNEPRAANIIAEGPVECYTLGKTNFIQIFGPLAEQLNNLMAVRILKSIKRLANYSENVLLQCLQIGTAITYRQDDTIAIEHTEAHDIMIFQTGMIALSQTNENGDSVVVDRKHAGQYLGDEALSAEGNRWKHTATVVSGLAEVIHINAQRIIAMADSNEEQSRRNRSRSTYRRFSSLLGLSSNQPAAGQGTQEIAQLDLNDLEELHTLGEGTFGTVLLVRVRSINKYFAMKRIQTSIVEDAGQLALTEREKVAMQSINSSFVCKLFGVASDETSDYLFLEYLCGGELWSLLYDPDTPSLPQGKFGGITQADTVLFAGMVILAIEHVHMSGFVYRDLKPENLMISAQGYLKIVDFGFTKKLPYIGSNGGIEDRTFTLCGTPDYMAPEVVLTKGHDKSVDYWASGVLIYELLCGCTPFESQSQPETFKKIVQSQRYLGFPPKFDPHAKSLIRKLLHPNAGLRLGALQSGFSEIKDHPFFVTGSLDWEALERQELPAPFIPKSSI